MNGFIPYSKLSKKEKRKLDSKNKVFWSDLGGIFPVTRHSCNKLKKVNKYQCRNTKGE